MIGNVAVHQLPALPPWGVMAALGLSAALVAASRPTRLVAVLIVAATGTMTVAKLRLADRLPAAPASVDVQVTGWIDRFPSVDPTRAVFSLRVVASDADVPRRVRLSWYDPPPALRAGVSLDLKARLRAPRGLKNPDGFDYESWLFGDGVGATGYVLWGEVDADRRHGLGQTWMGLRANVADAIERAAAEPAAAALMIALSIGERGAFDDDMWLALRRTGTSHLVAISGLHVGLIAAGAFFFVLRLALRLPYRFARHAWSLAAGATILGACAYAGLAGFSVPTRRALVMVVVAQLVVVARRRVESASALALAVLVVLGVDPLASLSASFWLSFGAVALILLIASRVAPASRSRRRLRLGMVALSLVRLQWYVTVGLIPLVATFFGEVSLIAFAVNIVAIPLFSFVLVPLSLLAALVTSVGGPELVLNLTGWLASAVWTALGEIAAWPYAAVAVVPTTPAALALSLVAVGLALPWHALPGRPLMLAGLLPLLLNSPERHDVGTAAVTVFDVGHGLAISIDTASHRLLYDTGPVFRSGFDVGAEIVVPSIARRDRAPLDTVIVSHGDNDHAGGLSAIVAAFPTASVLHGPDQRVAGGLTCEAGQRWTWDGVRFEILHPTPGFASLGNDSSCVLRVTARDRALLITGDIEAAGEAELLREGLTGADVVVVPHHGSATSSTRAFVAAVSPDLAIVSAGHANRWGFPRPDVRQRWEARGARVLVTGDVGAITFTLGETQLRPDAERHLRRRYWQSETPTFPGA